MNKRVFKNDFFFFLLIFLLVLSSCVKDRVTEADQNTPGIIDPGERELLHYWDFNSGALLNASYSVTAGAVIQTENTYDDTDGSALNLRRDSEPGQALRVRNPSTFMVIKSPTTGYRDPLLTFSVMRTNNGAQENIIEYTIDGVNYTREGIGANVVTVMTEWQVFSFDFSGIDGVDNNPDFAVRISFSIGNENESGNDRYDNVSIDAVREVSPEPEEPSSGDSLIHYWSFNSSLEVPDQSVGGTDIVYEAVSDGVSEGTDMNARLGMPPGNAIRLRNPAGDFFVTIPTAGFKDIIVRYAVMRTNNGARTNHVFYTIDGINYIQTGLDNQEYAVTESFVLQILDFTGIEGVDNNPNFKIKIVFADGHDNPSGNNRYDNLSVEGKLL